MRAKQISMPFLELFTVVAAALTWGYRWKGKKVTFRTDAEAAMHAINGSTAKDPGMAHLLRQLAIHACRHQYDFRAVHIAGAKNVIADELSRHGSSAQFRSLCPQSMLLPTLMAPVICPPPVVRTV